ncbi:MAG: hypothetical protein ACRD2N_10770 [Vicinamibacterales bacterium]
MQLVVARVALIVPIALVMIGCDDPVTTPTTPTTQTVTETFTGTLNRNGAITHNFVAGTFGTVTSTLTAVTPDTTVIGMALGTWNGIACQLIIAADKAALNTTVTGNVSSVGNLCVRLYDVGNITEPTSYEVQVIHP